MEYVLIAIMVLVIIATVLVNRFTSNNENPYPFERKKELYNSVEIAFLNLLERAVGDKYRVVSRVKLGDVIRCQPGLSNQSKRIALTKLQNKQLDFVLLDKNTLNIVAAVDLVNNANKDGHKAQRDWFVNGALETAGVAHIRMKIKSGYRADEIRNAILFKLGKAKTAANTKTAEPRKSARPAVLSPTATRAQLQKPSGTALAEV